MNLNYVKDFLRTRGNGITADDIQQLISEIEAYQGTESTVVNISRVMTIVNEHCNSILTRVAEYEAIPKEDFKELPSRVEKVREILCLLSSLNTYLMLSLTNINENTYDTKSIKKYLVNLKEKREHYQSERIAWTTILKSLTQEMNFVIEMRRMDIEDKIGYNSKK